MVERLNGIEKVRGSTPLISTTMKAHQAQYTGGLVRFLFSGGIPVLAAAAGAIDETWKTGQCKYERAHNLL